MCVTQWCVECNQFISHTHTHTHTHTHITLRRVDPRIHPDEKYTCAPHIVRWIGRAYYLCNALSVPTMNTTTHTGTYAYTRMHKHIHIYNILYIYEYICRYAYTKNDKIHVYT